MQNHRLLIFGLIWSTICFSIYADTVFLKDGRKLEGVIKTQDAERVVIDMNGMELTLPASRVERIEKQESDTSKKRLDFTKLYPVVGRQDEEAFKKLLKNFDLSNIDSRDQQKLDRMEWIVERKPVNIEAVKKKALENIDQVRGYEAEKILKKALEKNPYSLELRKLLIDYWRKDRLTNDDELMVFIAEHCSFFPESELSGLAEELSERTEEKAKRLADSNSVESYLYLQLHFICEKIAENPDDTQNYISAFLAAAESLEEGKVLTERPGCRYIARHIAEYGVRGDVSRQSLDTERKRREKRDKDWAKYYDNIERGNNVLIPNPRPPYEFALAQIYIHPFEMLKKHIRNVPAAQWDKEIKFYHDYLNWALYYWVNQDEYTLDTVKLMSEMVRELASLNDFEKAGRTEVLNKLNASEKDRGIAAMEFLRRYRGKYLEPVWFYTYEKTLEVYEGDQQFRDRYDQHAIDRIMDMLQGLEREHNIQTVYQRVMLIARFADKSIERAEVKDRFVELRDTSVTESRAYELYMSFRRRPTWNMNEYACKQSLDELDKLKEKYAETRWAVKFEECKERFQERIEQLEEKD